MVAVTVSLIVQFIYGGAQSGVNSAAIRHDRGLSANRILSIAVHADKDRRTCIGLITYA